MPSDSIKADVTGERRMSKIQDITEKNFNTQVQNAPLPFLLDFFGPNCPPCEALHKILEDLAKEVEGKMIVGRIDVSKNMDVARAYTIMGVPTLAFFKEGKIQWQQVGAMGKEKILEKCGLDS